MKKQASNSQILSQQPKIIKVEWQNKLTDLFDYDIYGMKRLISVYPESVFYYKTLLKSMEKDPRVLNYLILIYPMSSNIFLRI